MSFNGDLLNATTPTRLRCEQGTWVLELVRFVPVDRNVFQPKTQRLEGSEAILQHLKRADNAALAAATTQLMRGLRSDEEHSFEAADGDWVPGTPDTLLSMRPGAAAASNSSNEVWDLRAELMVLLASHDRLRERVARLESQLSSAAAVQRSREQSALSATALQIPTIREAVASPQQLPAARSAEPSDPNEEAALSARTAAAVEAARVQASARPPARIKFPPVSGVNTCLRALLGDKVSVKEKKPAKFAPTEGEAYWVSPLIDDEGTELGVIVADVTATTTLGGILMMLPEQEVNAQRAAKTPSADTIDAMSEVSNNLSAALNQLPDAVRLRVRPIDRMAEGSLDWTANAHQMQFDLAGGMGSLYLISR